MSPKERVELIGLLEILTGYPYEYLKTKTDEWLLNERNVRQGVK